MPERRVLLLRLDRSCFLVSGQLTRLVTDALSKLFSATASEIASQRKLTRKLKETWRGRWGPRRVAACPTPPWIE